MLIAGLVAIFAVALMGMTMMVSSEAGSGAAVEGSPGLFKTGAPTLRGAPGNLGVREGSVEVPATLEAGRSGVKPRVSPS